MLSRHTLQRPFPIVRNILSTPARRPWFRALLFAGLTLALALAVGTRAAAAASLPQGTRPEGSQDATILIQFAPETPDEERTAIIAQTGGELVSWLAPIHVAEVRIPAAAGAQENQAAAAGAASLAGHLQSAPAVQFAEMDLAVSAAYMPNDPAFQDENQSYGLEKIQMPKAWDLTQGAQRVVVAVVDSGIRSDHPAFAGRLAPGYDFVDDDDQPNDESGHGTHIAGVVAAGMDDGAGMAGVCPQCRIMPVRVLNAVNQGNWSDLAKGIIFAADHGAQVINLSLGATTTSRTLEAAVDYAQQQGVLVVAAAGNMATDQSFYPAALPDVIGVSATNMADALWEKSGYGASVDLAAPGDLIFSTYNDLDNVFGGYTYLSGTSMAAPFVSGLAGLVFSAAPDLTAAQVSEALFMGAEDLGAPGWDAEFGHGRINAYRTLTAPVEPLAQSIARLANRDGDDSLRPANAHAVFLPVLSN